MTICSQCGRENEGDPYFCNGCGANLKVQAVSRSALSDDTSGWHCRSCGTQVPVSHRYCGNCGARQRPRTAGTEIAHRPVVPPLQRAQLVVINPDGTSGESLELQQGENLLGREHGPQRFREDAYLSPRHAAFYLEEGRLQVRDLQSLNGVYRRIVEPTELRHLDMLRIGRQLLRFERLDQSEAMIAPDESDTRVLGSPRGEAWGRLERVSSPGRSSEAFLLSAPEEVIGRERGTLLLHDDGFVSGRHARLTSDGGRCQVEDLESSNGTFVRMRGGCRLDHGDLILMGQQPLRVALA